MTESYSSNDARLLRAGIVAGVVFLGVSTVEIFARPGFDIMRHAISVLSLGERGWLMVATFILSGLLVLACAMGLRRALPGSRWVPILIGLYGLGLILAGIFPAPSGMGFPPGTPDDQMPVMTPIAIIHSIAFMLAFGSLIAACFVLAPRLADGWSAFSLTAGIVMPVLIIIGMAGVIPPGIAFFLAAALGWIWLGAIALHLSSPADASTLPAALTRAPGGTHVL